MNLDRKSKKVKFECKKNQNVRQDIYGRLIDAEGNLISSTRYIPPSQRIKETDENDLATQRLKKQLKGLLNRLSESNMAVIVNEIEGLYMRNSRNNVNNILINLILEAVVQVAPTPDRLILEHCMMITILHANIGSEIGAYMIEILVNKFTDFKNQSETFGEGKSCDNLILLLVYLYTFKVFHAVLIYDILDILIEKFNEKSIELILLVLRAAGFTLRKNDPLRLKSVITKVKGQAKENAKEFCDDSRVKFMLDILKGIGNNNLLKIPNYDDSHREHLRKILKSFIRKGNAVQELKVSLEDLQNIESKGRWWIVGSSWTNTSELGNKETKPSVQLEFTPEETVSDKIYDLAMKLHINTDIRKNIFSVIMTAEDYIDAFEKILKLSLKNAQEKEAIHVTLECCLKEKKFNPFYGYLLQKFCTHDRKYQMMVQYAIWDKLKELVTATSLQISNLSQLLVHLIMAKALAISVLKVIEFADINKPTVRFLRQTLLKILLNDPHQTMEEVFLRVAGLPKLHVFREGILLFMKHFMLKNKDKLSSSDNKHLEERINTAKAALQNSDQLTRF